MNFRLTFLPLILSFLVISVVPNSGIAQDHETSVYFEKRVEDSNGDQVNHTIPTVLFTTYLNSEQDSILIENAPRWDGGESNYDAGNSLVGVELQNFKHFGAGDTVTIRFTDRKLEERDFVSQEIDTIPWSDPNPFKTLALESVNLPTRPRNVSISVSDNSERTITWDAASGLTYEVYRRARLDTIFNGEPRNLYIRVADNVSSGSYTDSNTNPDKHFAYIVYAENKNGVKSVHSREVFQQRNITGLTVKSKTARNVTLSWNAYDPLVDDLAGYNIYRKKEGETYGSKPLAYTGTEAEYTDTRLEPGQTYHYKVVPRNYERNEMGNPQEIEVTTESSTDGYMTYANLKMAVVIYANAPAKAPAVEPNQGDNYVMSEGEIEDIKFLVERVREYYWRNTKMQLNLETDYIVFRKDLLATDVATTGQHLVEERGVVSTQYDLVYRITPSRGGFWSWGATHRLQLPGPDRRTGFSQSRWPYRGFVIDGFGRYPKVYPEIDYQDVGNNLIWTFTHESQHSIDGIYKANDHPEMGHGDKPQLYATENISNSDIGCCYPGFPEHYSKKFGKRFSFQSTMMRDFRPYKDLKSNWGDIYEVKDADGDGIPDHDSRVPVTEQSFGTSTSDADSDGDGYTDKQEAIDGIFEYSVTDPHKVDTDGDGTPDGKDSYPRYPMDTRIKTTADGFMPKVDGDLSDWPEHTLVVDTVSKVEGDEPFAPKVYMAYSNDSLYVALDLPTYAKPTIRWDFDANGFRYGSGNTTMEINVNNGGSFATLKTMDASQKARDYEEKIKDKKSGIGNGFWDDNSEYIEKFGRILTDADVNLSVRNANSGPQIEIAIPESEEANLTLQDGVEIGFHVDYSDVKTLGLEARTFDSWNYAYVDFSGLKATEIASDQNELAESFTLNQNYPNPFNPTTTIEYSLAETGKVTLKVFDMLGRKVATLINDRKNAGHHKVQFDASDLSSGVYFYRLKAGNKSQIRKMTLIK